jgi:hypothetical protein
VMRVDRSLVSHTQQICAIFIRTVILRFSCRSLSSLVLYALYLLTVGGGGGGDGAPGFSGQTKSGSFDVTAGQVLAGYAGGGGGGQITGHGVCARVWGGGVQMRAVAFTDSLLGVSEYLL